MFDYSIILQKMIEPRLLRNIRIFDYSNIRIGNSIHSSKAKNLTTLDLAEIEKLLYKSRSLNMKQKELHQNLS